MVAAILFRLANLKSHVRGKKFTQKQLITFTANLQTSLIGVEACSGAHFLGRVPREQGHGQLRDGVQFWLAQLS
jgi:hypothetical protein